MLVLPPMRSTLPSCTHGKSPNLHSVKDVTYESTESDPRAFRYMPKDEPSTGIGHRHDWEEAIVWLTGDASDATMVAFSVSAHGGISSSTSPGLSGKQPLAQYVSYWPLDHQLDQTTTVGGTQPLIAWDSLPTVAQDALQDTDFGDAIVPFKDSTFTANLAKGYATL